MSMRASSELYAQCCESNRTLCGPIQYFAASILINLSLGPALQIILNLNFMSWLMEKFQDYVNYKNWYTNPVIVLH